MSEMRTMVRAQVVVNEVGFLLAQGQDVDDLKGEIESAVRDGPRFVEFLDAGRGSVSVLVSAATQVMISIDTVDFDHRDDGDDAGDTAPFGESFDLL